MLKLKIIIAVILLSSCSQRIVINGIQGPMDRQKIEAKHIAIVAASFFLGIYIDKNIVNYNKH